MENSFFHRLSGILWAGIVLLLVLLAIYVSVGRMFVGNLGTYRTQILQELNARVPFLLEAEKVSGEWYSFTPVIVLTDLRLSIPGGREAPLELSEGRLGVDVFNSLRTRSLQLTRISLTDLSLLGEMSSDGKFRFTGFGSGSGEIGDWLREFLLNVEFIALRNNLLKVTMPGGEVRNLDVNLLLSRQGSERRLQATLLSTRGAEIEVIAEGVGDPTRPADFAGNLYLGIQTSDLAAVREMLPAGAPPVWAEGQVDLKVWLAWDKGEPSMEIQLAGSKLRITADEPVLDLPVDYVAMQAHLRQEKNGWTLFTSDLQLTQGDVQLTLPRMQLDVWGNALQIRAQDVPVEPLNRLVVGVEAVPEKLRDIFVVLQPRGRLTALQARVGNIEQLQGDWEVAVNFEDLGVEPFKGAPGVTAADGYAQLGPEGGFVILDSQNLTMEFPSIYHNALAFDEFYGTLYLDWEEHFFNLSSGLVTGRGEEGRAQVLFGLEIPLEKRESGIEMDLLVGLENTHPDYRAKYLPYGLNPSLLTWLSDSIGDGHIAQGAFLWRGSLVRGKAPMRTVQLAFNLADTRLEYDPRWPPLTVQSGVVYIDDTAVSVWADQARLLQSTAHGVSVESRLNDAKEVILDIEGTVTGPAADGLQVLNESPVGDIVGGVFQHWRAVGELEADVRLQLNLGDKSVSPRVDVATRWFDTGLLINPGNLSLQSVDGDFTYSSTRGFSSDALNGTLWGKPVAVRLKQRHPDGSYRAGASELIVSARSPVDLADLRDWLQLKPLGFASGTTSADVAVHVVPGESPVLIASSNLEGVALDLPQPWNKPADRPETFSLQMPLASGEGPLSILLGEQLALDMDIGGGELRGGALGIESEPQPIEPGMFLVTGSAPLVEGDQWIAFAAEYFGTASSSPVEPVVDPVAGGEDPNSPVVAGLADQPGPAAPVKVVIEDLQADQLVILSQEVPDATLNLMLQDASWDVAVDTDWLRGSLLLDRAGGRSRLQVSHIDISRLADFSFSEMGAEQGESTLDLPPVDVDLENLYQSGERLGNLAFALHSTDGVLRAQNIRGELASLRFSEEEPAALTWHQGEQGNTQFRSALAFGDLGKTLEYFGYERIVETRSGSFDVDLSWPGMPQEFSLLQGDGSIMVNIGRGSFLEAPSGASGALRVVSILNLADIVQRLSLSHMFESGIPFDSVTGEVYLHNGTVEVAKMDVQGGSSFQFSGVSDIASQSLNGELVATLPVARNLPWIAALAASLPVAAGVYIVSKVFDKQMNRLSSAVYDISGSWDNPQVSFDRIFDNSTKGDIKPLPETTLSSDDPVDFGVEIPQEREPGDRLDAGELSDTQSLKPAAAEPSQSP